jgi:tetratricopeptide (TPR) repeat protein
LPLEQFPHGAEFPHGAGLTACYFPHVASLLSGLLGLLVATNQPAAVSNLVHQKTGAKIEVADPNDPVEREYLRLLERDDAAQAEVQRWVADNEKLSGTGAGADRTTMELRIRHRYEPVDKAYKDFLEQSPNHAKGRIAYGSFLNDIGREEEAAQQYLKAREIDPKNPAVWNNLANYYGHNSPVTNAFACYERAIDLDPNEPLYYHNFAITVYLFRMDATNYYGITEQQVFDKAMGLYRKAFALDPQNFPLATDLAQSYYGIHPPRVADAFKAWNDAMKLAGDEIERQGIRLHLARWHKTAGDFDAARAELELVTNQIYATTKSNVLKTIVTAESRATNSVLPPVRK